MNFLLRWVDRFLTTRVDSNLSENILAVQEALDGHNPNQSRKLACVALLLGRTANADLKITDAERKKLAELLSKRWGIDEKQASEVTAVSLEKSVAHQVEDHLVLRELKECTDREERFEIMRSLFELASEDDINSEENEALRLIAHSLEIGHRDFVALRSEWREYLSVLKNPSN